MSHTVYVGGEFPRLHRLGWVEIHRNLDNGTIVAVPSLTAHDSKEYLHASVNGNRVTVSVEKRS